MNSQTRKATPTRHEHPRTACILAHVTRDDPPVLLAFPKVEPLPATNAGSAIHHAMFGMKVKEKADAAGATCVLRIKDQKPGVDRPKPEAFLLKQWTGN